MSSLTERSARPDRPPVPRLVIGLVGQVCAGKSSVARAFQERGAAVYEADRLVHELYEEEAVKDQVRRLFGQEVFDAHGGVDRRKLGAVVFANEEQLRRLTGEVIFPRTGKALQARLEAFRSAPDPAAPQVLVLDAPTLLEAGHADCCDRLLFVAAPRERRERWAQEKRGWTPDELALRERRLMDEESKRARCQAVLENFGSKQDLALQVQALWRRWVEQGEA